MPSTWASGPRSRQEWVLLAYRLPREPSTPRIALWRRLKRLGAVQLVDNLVALPHDDRTREQLDWLAAGIVEAGGEAGVWIGRAGTAAQERTLAERMAASIAAEYRALVEAAEAAPEGANARRTLTRLRRSLHEIRSRDYFPPPERERAERAVEELAALVQAPA